MNLHVGDVGTEIKVHLLGENSLPVDISTATVKQFKFKSPKGSSASQLTTRTAAFKTDGTDGVLHYYTIAGDLAVKGEWRLQAYVEMPGWQGHSDIITFKVEEVLE